MRKSGVDIDLIVSTTDYEALAKQYPNNLKDVWGDLGVVVGDFEIWKTIRLYNYEFLSQGASDLGDVLVISLEKLLFMTALSALSPENDKYMSDLKLIVAKVMEIQYKGFDDSKYR